MKSVLVRMSEESYKKMKMEKPPNMTQAQYFDLVFNNQSRIIETQEEILRRLDVILKKISETGEDVTIENPKDFLQELLNREEK